MRKVIDAIIDEGSWLEIKKLFAKELLDRVRAARRTRDRHRGEPTDAKGRSALQRLGRQSGAFHLALRRVRDPAAVFWRTCQVS